MQERWGRFALAAALIFFASGCKPQGPPPPLTLEELPRALENAFKPKSEATEGVTALLAALGEKDYSKALMTLQTVSALPGLNKEQARVAAAGLITINNALQEAQTRGDQNAAQTLRSYRATK